ncbi:MAG: hypothetical protein QXO70_03005 [Candidatus Pacearchaeota archaeon]
MIESLIKTLISHPILISILGPFLFGGETTLILGILAGQGFIPFFIALIFCAIGIWIADLMWFSIGKIEALSKLKKIKFIYIGYKKAKEEIERAPNEVFLLILIKFAYGIGIPLLTYLGRRGMKYKDFILKNSIIIIIWSFSITIFGWFIGKTSKIAFTKFENVYTSIGLIVTGIIVVHIIVRQIRAYLLKKKN